MSGAAFEGLRLIREPERDLLRLELRAPRANALEPDLLDAIRRALDEIERAPPALLLLTGGRNFCSGGDVGRFLAAARAGEARAYALRVVPALQEVLLRLLAAPSLVLAAARGAVTGGGAGFLFAADLAAASPDAFVQPWYGVMGFAPDGGWTAILPEKIGAGRALGWLASDARASGEELRGLGLVQAVAEDPEAAVLRLALEGDAETLRRAKALIWDAPRLAETRRRLEAETEAFLALIDRPETRARMERFLS